MTPAGPAREALRKRVGARILGRMILWIFRTRVDLSAPTRAVLAEGRAIVAANHVSLLDGVLIAAACPTPLVCAVDTDFSRRSAIARAGLLLLERIGFGVVVPLDMNSPFGMRRIAAELKAGQNVLLFPEGRIGRVGEPVVHCRGLGWLASRTEACLIPLKIRGAESSRLFAKMGTRWWPAIAIDDVDGRPIRSQIECPRK